jgi:hypothetical protein
MCGPDRPKENPALPRRVVGLGGVRWAHGSVHSASSLVQV